MMRIWLAAALSAALILALCGSGCALRATTDFGPQSSNSTRSLSAGPEGLPGSVSGVSGPQGNSIELGPRDGDAAAGAGSPTGTGDNAGTGGTR